MVVIMVWIVLCSGRSDLTVDGPVKAINMSIRESGLMAKEIDYINAHATSTPVGDAKEAKAIDVSCL